MPKAIPFILTPEPERTFSDFLSPQQVPVIMDMFDWHIQTAKTLSYCLKPFTEDWRETLSKELPHLNNEREVVLDIRSISTPEGRSLLLPTNPVTPLHVALLKHFGPENIYIEMFNSEGLKYHASKPIADACRLHFKQLLDGSACGLEMFTNNLHALLAVSIAAQIKAEHQENVQLLTRLAHATRHCLLLGNDERQPSIWYALTA
jgi:hypothetical protein